jgi:hypothetical protein
MEEASSQNPGYQVQYVPFSELLSRDDTQYAHGMGVAVEELMSAESPEDNPLRPNRLIASTTYYHDICRNMERTECKNRRTYGSS